MTDFEQVVEEHHPIFYKICRAYTSPADFDDLYQEILINLWKSLKNFKGRSRISTYIYRVALNTALSYNRTRKRNLVPFDSLSNAGNVADTGTSDSTERENALNALENAIRQLRKDEKSIILLYLDECSYDEISEIIGISKSNVGVKINRIKRKLYTILNNK